MLEFHRKKYRGTIEISPDRILHLEYEQGTFGDLLEMSQIMEDSPEGLFDWLSDFFYRFSKEQERIDPKELSNFPPEALSKILQPILDTFAKGYFSRLDNEEETKKASSDHYSPQSSFICYILEHSNETLESLKAMTWEMVTAMQEGIIWNIREQTKQGREDNKRDAALKASRLELPDQQALKIAKELARRMDNGTVQSD